jgi:hypothetical protein
MIILLTIWKFTKLALWFVIDNWKVVLPIVLVLVAAVFVFKACNKPPSLNEKQIQKAEQAVKERNDKVLKEILAESDTRVDAIDSNIKLSEERTRDAVKSYEGMTVDELAAEIERRKNQ